MVLRLCRVLSDKFMRMADLALWYSPVGICFLIATDTMRFSDFSTVVWHLGQYAFTVFLGLGVHSFLVLPALYLTRVRRQACHFFFNLLYPLSIAFGVSGSSAAISVAMATLERRVGLDPATVRLVLPLGAIMNRDGTALYNMVTTLFCAQLQGATLNFTSLLVLLVACAFTSLSLLGIHPRFAATAHVSLLLSVIGLPSDNIGYIAMLHWLLDRACSSVNLMSDCVGAAVLQDPELFLPTCNSSTGRRLGSSSNVLVKRMQLLSPREPSPTPNLPGPFRASKATQ
ncbi:hypothetical protein HPB48_001997 [Haemaphysalis longicornis]|uniref:Amino acid transporter n=1 Tax=Haemaphysalis longicornis TaxID=44386 RepID=A0A9J6FSV8_HAELO|nr:hypothetical protein HPB48_001997 [Haemaphysalis longicornis]